ncbi:MAG TPA: hypothetical protein VFQ61_08125 [Polyangiaceae bacterium]|nr:hypothetical protein [Polyangiaceae bacterium]
MRQLAIWTLALGLAVPGLACSNIDPLPAPTNAKPAEETPSPVLESGGAGATNARMGQAGRSRSESNGGQANLATSATTGGSSPATSSMASPSPDPAQQVSGTGGTTSAPRLPVGEASDAPGGSGGAAGESSRGAAGESSRGRDCEAWFSEYVEGSGNNKALEIAASAQCELTGCSVLIFANGSETATRHVELTGTVAPSSPLVLCTAQLADKIARCDEIEALSFNGNDAVLLSCGESVLDRIGRVGEDPGEAWGDARVSTQDMTLQRDCRSRGDSMARAAFDVASTWIAKPLDTFEALGADCTSAR